MSGLFERPSLTEQIVQHLSDLITDGTWPAGTVVPPEAELARRLGVSRTVIREGVRVLASRGMLAVRQGRGTVVVAVDAWTVAEPLALLVRTDRAALLDWLEVRTILEMESAALAAERCTEEDRAALREAVGRVEGIDDSRAYMEADIHFHLTVARATHNSALQRLLRPVVQPLREQFQFGAMEPRVRADTAVAHRAIVDHILTGDAPGARAAMVGHLTGVVREIAALGHDATADAAGSSGIPVTQADHVASATSGAAINGAEKGRP